MSNEKTLTVPDLGDFADVEVIEILVKAGDELQPEDPVVTLETDKATMDVPATDAGKVTALRVKVGDRISKGDPVLDYISTANAAATAATAAPPAQQSAEAAVAEAPAPQAAACTRQAVAVAVACWLGRPAAA